MWNKIKSAIFVEEVLPNTDVAVKPLVHASAPVNSQVLPPPSSVAPNDKVQVMMKTIRDATMVRNTAFTALIRASEKLSSIITDPVQCLKAAFATSSEGRTVVQITEAISIHLADIDSEEIRFKQFLEKMQASDVDGALASIVGIEGQIQSNVNEIDRIQKTIDALRAKNIELEQQAINAKTAAENKRVELAEMSIQFKLAADSIRNELNTQKTTILSTFS